MKNHGHSIFENKSKSYKPKKKDLTVFGSDSACGRRSAPYTKSLNDLAKKTSLRTMSRRVVYLFFFWVLAESTGSHSHSFYHIVRLKCELLI